MRAIVVRSAHYHGPPNNIRVRRPPFRHRQLLITIYNTFKATGKNPICFRCAFNSLAPKWARGQIWVATRGNETRVSLFIINIRPFVTSAFHISAHVMWVSQREAPQADPRDFLNMRRDPYSRLFYQFSGLRLCVFKLWKRADKKKHVFIIINKCNCFPYTLRRRV